MKLASKLIGIILCISLNAATSNADINPNSNDYIKAVRREVAACNYRWRGNHRNQATGITSCYQSMRFMSSLLTGQNSSKDSSYINTNNQSHGTFINGNFLAETAKKDNNVFQRLLDCSYKDEKEHLLFNIRAEGHSFNIEKYSHQTSRWWRVYQSWDGNFSLRKWLGQRPWKELQYTGSDWAASVARENTQAHQEYGGGKKLTYESLRNFLSDNPQFKYLQGERQYTVCAFPIHSRYIKRAIIKRTAKKIILGSAFALIGLYICKRILNFKK